MSQTSDDVTCLPDAVGQTDDDGPAAKRICTGTITIPTEQYEKLLALSAAVKDSTSCCICLETAKVPTRFLPCRHEVCLICAGKYVQTLSKCPMCRASITKVEAVLQMDLVVPDTEAAGSDRSKFETIRKLVWPNRKTKPPMKLQDFRGVIRCLIKSNEYCPICSLMTRASVLSAARHSMDLAVKACKDAEKKKAFTHGLAINFINKP